MYQEYPTPAVVVELNIAERNVKKLIEENKKYNIAHRPHIKPHKSSFFAKMQLAAGAQGITCAKLGEAEVMARSGIRDILIAFPLIGEDKLYRLGELTKICKVKTIVNSVEGARGLSALGEKIGKKLETLIEVDSGINRGGLKPYGDTLAFAKAIQGLSGINITGLLYYGGNIYGENTKEGIIKICKQEHDEVFGTAELLRQHGFNLTILSAGSSFSAKFCEYLEGITEVRAGNYIFNDCNQLSINLITEADCALRIIATVVSRPDEYTAIIDAGSKTLTTDLCKFRPGYGYIIGHPDITIYKLNEEHGFLKSDNGINLKIGEKIAIIPNHACVIPNLVDEMYGLRDGQFERMILVEARGKNV